MTWIVVIITLLIFVFFVFRDAAQRKRRDSIGTELVNLLGKKRFDELEERLSDKDVIQLIPEYNRSMLRFNAAILNADQIKADEIFQHMKNVEMNELQKAAFYMQAFGYYLRNKKTMNCKYCLMQINSLHGFDKEKENTAAVYRILIEQKDDDLNMMLKKMNSGNSEERINTALLLSTIYSNRQEQDLADMYAKIAEMEMNK